MADLKPYAVFAETVAAGSMSAAARRLGMTPSAVSQTLRALERQTGVTLFHRSTRKLTLTEAGERCYPHCRRLLEAGQAAADCLAQAKDAPSGELRVAAPVGFGTYVASALAPVLAAWPQLSLCLIVDDAMIDLIDARIDIALRVGQLKDSSRIVRKLCDFEIVLCASPSYIARQGMPLLPSDLPAHQWMMLARERSGTSLRISAPNAGDPPKLALELQNPLAKIEHVLVNARITSTSQVALQQMCEQGIGIACLVYADVRSLLERGALIQVLPQWGFAPLPVNMVTQMREGEPAKVRVAAKALKSYFRSLRSTMHAIKTTS